MTTARPDHSRDIVVHRVRLVDALTSEPLGPAWSVWVGRENEGSYQSEGEALAAARRLAIETGRFAWLERESDGWMLLTSPR